MFETSASLDKINQHSDLVTAFHLHMCGQRHVLNGLRQNTERSGEECNYLDENLKTLTKASTCQLL